MEVWSGGCLRGAVVVPQFKVNGSSARTMVKERKGNTGSGHSGCVSRHEDLALFANYVFILYWKCVYVGAGLQ